MDRNEPTETQGDEAEYVAIFDGEDEALRFEQEAKVRGAQLLSVSRRTAPDGVRNTTGEFLVSFTASLAATGFISGLRVLASSLGGKINRTK